MSTKLREYFRSWNRSFVRLLSAGTFGHQAVANALTSAFASQTLMNASDTDVAKNPKSGLSEGW